jgi:ATP-dependent Clp protease ATP-binding subunit ClpB
MLTSLQQKLLAQRYTITFTPDVAPLLAQKGFDPIFGARPLRRVVQDNVEGMIARRILEGTLKPGDSLQVTTDMLQ